MKNKKRKHWAEVKKKKKRFKKVIYVKIMYAFLTIIFIGVTIYAFVFSGFLKINEVSIIGLKKISSEDAYQTVNELMNGKYFGIVSKDNFLFVRSGKIKKQFEHKFKKIEDIKIKKKFPNKLKIKITERNTLLILCSNSECYFVDKKGVAYAKANFKSEEVKQNKIIKLVDQSNQEIKEGECIFSEEFVKFLTSVSKKIKDESNIILLDDYRTASRVSEEIIVQTNKGWDIYLSSRFPLEKSIRMLKILLNRQLTLKEINNLEYVDLRSENKIFYRMKGDAIKEQKEIEEEKAMEKKGDIEGEVEQAEKNN